MSLLSLIVIRLIAFLLIAEGMLAAVHVAGLLPQLAVYDAVAVALILARGLVGALQFMSGWMIATRRPQGLILAQWALLAGAALTFAGVGLGLAPTSIYHWLRWQATGAYAVYAAISIACLRKGQRSEGKGHR